MKSTLQKNTGLFFSGCFLLFSVFALISSVAVCFLSLFGQTLGTGWWLLIDLFVFSVATFFYHRYFASKKWSVPACLSVCFLLRLFYVRVVQVPLFSDFRMYHVMASSILGSTKLLSRYGAVFPHTVGFSALLAGFYRMVGISPDAVQIGNVILETATAFLLYQCAKQLFAPRVASVSLFLYTISPSFVLYSEFLATEILFTFLFFVILFFAIRMHKTQKLSYGVFLGILCAIMNAIRPCGLILILSLLLYLLLICHCKKRVAVLMLAVICYSGGAVACHHVITHLNGAPVASSPVGYNLFVGANRASMGKWNRNDYLYAGKLLYDETISPNTFHRHFLKEGIRRFSHRSTLENLSLMTEKFGVLWGSEMLPCDYACRDFDYQAFDRIIPTAQLANAFHLMLMFGIFLGAIILWKTKRRDGVLYICIFVMGIGAQHLVAEVQERYSYTALAAMMMIGAFGLCTLFERRGTGLFKHLREDIRAVMQKDPAAKNVIEVFLLSPGIHALFWHRVAHRLYGWHLFFLARLISQLVRFFTGIEIHPGAKIGRGVMIDHGMGVVIGETAEVGDGCTIYQNVTLGGTGKDKGKRHPTIGKNVMIGSGAKVLGPFTVGDNSKIAANAVVLREVPPNSTCVGVPARIVVRNQVKLSATDWQMDQTHIPDPLSQELCRMLARIEKIEANQWKDNPQEGE